MFGWYAFDYQQRDSALSETIFGLKYMKETNRGLTTFIDLTGRDGVTAASLSGAFYTRIVHDNRYAWSYLASILKRISEFSGALTSELYATIYEAVYIEELHAKIVKLVAEDIAENMRKGSQNSMAVRYAARLILLFLMSKPALYSQSNLSALVIAKSELRPDLTMAELKDTVSKLLQDDNIARIENEYRGVTVRVKLAAALLDSHYKKADALIRINLEDCKDAMGMSRSEVLERITAPKRQCSFMVDGETEADVEFLTSHGF